MNGGGVGERLKPAVLKTVRPVRVSGVRIPPPPCNLYCAPVPARSHRPDPAIVAARESVSVSANNYASPNRFAFKNSLRNLPCGSNCQHNLRKSGNLSYLE